MRIWLILGWVLSLALVIDCAVNRRHPIWYLVLALPGGWLVYLVRFRDSLTFPLVLGRRGSGPKRCARCQKVTASLEPFEDGRSIHFLCSMCRAELELVRQLQPPDV